MASIRFYTQNTLKGDFVQQSLTRLETLDTEQANIRQNGVYALETQRNEMLTTIKDIVDTLKKKSDSHYTDFIPLFTKVQNLATLNIHDAPSWDAFWGLKHTNYMYTGLGYVRHAAVDVLEKLLSDSRQSGSYSYLIPFIYKEAEKLDLFKLPRSNWAIKSPTSINRAYGPVDELNRLQSPYFDTTVYSPFN